MAGQGYHLGMLKLICEDIGVSITPQFIAGALIIDALNSKAGSRRNTHFTGGAGCILPRFTELRQCGSTIQSWDSGLKKSYLVDPKIDMKLFEAVSLHIPETNYKTGLRAHLLADKYYDTFIQHKLFDVSRQSENIIISRATGETMDGATFRKELYASYPMLDQYLMEMAGITRAEFDETKGFIESIMPPELLSFFDRYFVWREGQKWEDTKFFKLEEVSEFIDSTVQNSTIYLLNRASEKK